MSTTIPPTTPQTPPTFISPRFTLELEFVLCLANPYYLQYLASEFPTLLNPPLSTTISTQRTSRRSRPTPTSDEDNSPAACFARYLAYLHGYWRTPQYSQYLTHPGAVLRNLALLQSAQFRKDLIRPDVIEKLLVVEDNQMPGDVDMDGVLEVVGAVDQEGGAEGQRMDAGPD